MRMPRISCLALLLWVLMSQASLAAEGPQSYFTDLPLITQGGETVHFYRDLLADQVVLINGFYTDCPQLCPTQGATLARLQKLLGDQLGHEVRLISITVDPRHDDPQTVRDFAALFNPRPGWVFLSGKPENVDWVNYKLGLYTKDRESHNGLYLLGNLKTGLWKKLSPSLSPQKLYAKVQEVLADPGTD